MSVKGTRLPIGKASLAVGAGLLGLSLMSVMTADDGPPDAVLAELQSPPKELAEKVGGAGVPQLLHPEPKDQGYFLFKYFCSIALFGKDVEYLLFFCLAALDSWLFFLNCLFFVFII